MRKREYFAYFDQKADKIRQTLNKRSVTVGDMAKMTEKQKRFVQEYLIDLNAHQAAIRAGYKHSGKKPDGSRLLAVPHIAEAIARAQADRADRMQITADYVLQQAVKLHERCMQDIQPHTDRKGDHIRDDDGNPLYVFNAAGAIRALELVGKHVNIRAFRDQVGVSGPDGGPVEVDTTSPSEQIRAFIEKMVPSDAPPSA